MSSQCLTVVDHLGLYDLQGREQPEHGGDFVSEDPGGGMAGSCLISLDF